MKNVKIVFIDLDGTLKDSNQKISIRHMKIFKKLADNGIQVVFTTGRSLPYTMSLSKQFMTSNYIISSNGAEIYNFGNKKVLYHNFLSRDVVIKLGELMRKHNMFFIANCLLKTYTNKDFGDPGKKIVNSIDDILDENISQLIVESYDLDTMKLFRRDMNEIPFIKISNKTKNPNETTKILYYDVTCSDVSKGNAIRFLCDYLNIDLNDAMAIGDSDNDIDMLEAVGVKVAMGNANDTLKKLSNIVTCSNDEEGVAVILEKLYEEILK